MQRRKHLRQMCVLPQIPVASYSKAVTVIYQGKFSSCIRNHHATDNYYYYYSQSDYRCATLKQESQRPSLSSFSENDRGAQQDTHFNICFAIKWRIVHTHVAYKNVDL